MFVRQLEYLAALAREKHYGRAAAACRVSQPTLSAGISKLEVELGVPIVMRGHRFLDLTPEGSRILAWAQRMLADFEGMRQDLSMARQGLSGRLRVGAVPAALPSIALITAPFATRYPAVDIRIASLSSIAIQRALDDSAIDVGVTYLENEPLMRVRTMRLYRERYLFVTPTAGPLAARRTMPWADAATVPLCPLSGDMQNRRIIDAIFREVGIASAPMIETNSFVVLCSHVRHGAWSSILPHSYSYVFGKVKGLRAIPLVKPTRTQWIGLAAADREPMAPMADALMGVALDLDIERVLLEAAGLPTRRSAIDRA